MKKKSEENRLLRIFPFVLAVLDHDILMASLPPNQSGLELAIALVVVAS